MLLDSVDAADRRLGTVIRRDVFSSKAGFRVAHIFLFNTSGAILLQQLAGSRLRFPFHWGSSVAAYLFSGESYVGAAQRRVEQELGVSGLVLDPVLKTAMNDNGCQKFIELFTAVFDGTFMIDRSHIAKVDFFAPTMIETAITQGARQFTPTFLHLWNRFKASIQP